MMRITFMKSRILTGARAAVLIAAIAATTVTTREAPPAPAPIKKLALPSYTEMAMKNGLQVVVVEHHEQPVASIWLAIKAGSVLDPEGKASLAEYTAALINKGTKDKDSKKLASWIESVGGTFN